MKEFVFHHWRDILLLGYSAFMFILFLFKKFRVCSDKEIIFKEIPGLICKAESIHGAGHGLEKKAYVMDMIISLYKSYTGCELNLNSKLFKYFSEIVESILSTPSKKGEFVDGNETKNE